MNRNRQLKSHLIWQGKDWRLLVVRQVLPDGSTADKGLIEHPGSVVIVPIIDEQVLTLRQYRLTLKDHILELPAGTRHQDESWTACAQRELREETGYRAGSWQDLGHVWPAPGITNEVMALFLADGLEPDPLPGDVDEEIELAPTPLDKLIAMALDGRLQDAKSIIGILRAAAHLGKKLA